MKKILIASLIAAGGFASQAHAQAYGELGFTPNTFKSTFGTTAVSETLYSVRGILGYEVAPNLAFEVMGSVGTTGATVRVGGTDVKVESDYGVGIYAKPKVKLSDTVEFFGRFGYGRSEGSVTPAGGAATKETRDDYSFGAGISVAVSPMMSVNADYMRYMNKDGIRVGGFTLGLGFKF
jgi:opacity protein-like surface antigen